MVMCHLDLAGFKYVYALFTVSPLKCSPQCIPFSSVKRKEGRKNRLCLFMKRLLSSWLPIRHFYLSSRCNLIIYIHVRSINLCTQHKDEVRNDTIEFVQHLKYSISGELIFQIVKGLACGFTWVGEGRLG
jgi:hypothetical protein